VSKKHPRPQRFEIRVSELFRQILDKVKGPEDSDSDIMHQALATYAMGSFRIMDPELFPLIRELGETDSKRERQRKDKVRHKNEKEKAKRTNK